MWQLRVGFVSDLPAAILVFELTRIFMVFLNFIFGALRWGQYGTYGTYVAYVRYVVLAKTSVGSTKVYSENYVQNLEMCLAGMTREQQKFVIHLEQRIFVLTPF